jgi:hypothetical protein
VRDDEALRLEFQLADEQDLSPTDFRDLFDAIDGLMHDLLVKQILSFTEMAGIPARARAYALGQGGQNYPVPE